RASRTCLWQRTQVRVSSTYSSVAASRFFSLACLDSASAVRRKSLLYSSYCGVLSAFHWASLLRAISASALSAILSKSLTATPSTPSCELSSFFRMSRLPSSLSAAPPRPTVVTATTARAAATTSFHFFMLGPPEKRRLGRPLTARRGCP